MATHIKGSTRLYGLVGHRLAAAKSPQLLNPVFMDQGEDAVCIPFEVTPDGLCNFVIGARALNNLAGLLVTMPHKQSMLALVDELHPTARQVGAINVVRCESDGRWVGAVFDGLGCVLGMQQEGHEPAGKSVLLVGAGGAGRAIAFAVAGAGARSLTVCDADEQRARSLAESVAAETGCATRVGPPDPRGHHIVINATPLGMGAHDPLPVDPERLEPDMLVVDIINSPHSTPLCRAAREKGCSTQDGGHLHRGQARLVLRFLGVNQEAEGEPGGLPPEHARPDQAMTRAS